MKRWNRQNELLADGAERASVGAEWLGGRPYPRDRLLRAWLLAMNQFAGILTSASEAIASRLDTQAEGTAVVVYSPLDIEREDVMAAEVSLPGGEPKADATHPEATYSGGIGSVRRGNNNERTRSRPRSGSTSPTRAVLTA